MKELLSDCGCSGEDKSPATTVLLITAMGLVVMWSGRARDACLERAGLREDYGLRGEAWVLVLQATAL